jgi:hypothetical protein
VPKVTVPAEPIVPPDAVNVVTPPAQIAVGFLLIEMADGVVATVMVTVAVEEQPAALVPVTV